MSSRRRNRLVAQTQTSEPKRSAFCGLFSINNAMQVRDFISVKDMRSIVERLKLTHPNEDHGDVRYGHYSVMAMQHALQAKGFNLIFLNNMPFLKKAQRRFWVKRLASTSFRRVIIIGRPPKQRAGISHCIARFYHKTSTAVPGQFDEKPLIMCPDEGEWKICSEGSLGSFLPWIDGAYAILSHEELANLRSEKKIPHDATF